MFENSPIAFVNQCLLEHPSLWPVLTDLDPELPKLVNGINFLGNASSFYNRMGKNTMFCKNTGSNRFNKSLTNCSMRFDQSFEQVSDQRCAELRKSHWNKPWVIMWSGGIDSTVIVASILRNLPSSDFSNIKIWCSSGSIYENPKFFVDHIQPNFDIINNPDVSLAVHGNDFFIIEGGPGSHWGLEEFNSELRKHRCEELSWRNNKDRLLLLLSGGTSLNADYCKWMYNALAENIHSTGLPIDTIDEWCWWAAFNQGWGAVNLIDINHYVPRSLINRTIIDNKVDWFDSEDYQRWSIQNFKNTKKRIGKLDSKKYIHTVSDDEHYLKFKRKIRSSQRIPHNHYVYDNPKTPEQYAYLASHHYFCILENLEFLYLDTDFDRIVELLPDHFNLDSLQYLE